MIDSPIGTGILGAGKPNIATSNQLPASMQSDWVNVVALCDRLDSVEDYAARYGCAAYRDYAAMLENPAIEMVQVATPDWLHVEHTLQALAAGKHVLLQKPPATNLDDLTRLREAITPKGPRLKVLLNSRESALPLKLKQLLEDGVIGELRHVRIDFRGKRFPIDQPDSPYLKKELGGVWIHNGLHWLDEAFYYSEKPPRSVQVFTTRNEHGPASCLGEGPNYWTGLFEMGERVTFRFEYNTMLMQDGLPGGMRRILIGTEGEIRQDFGETSPTVYRLDREQPEHIILKQDPREDAIHSFRRAIDAFAREIRTGEVSRPRLSDSLQLMECLLRGVEASGETVQFV